MTDHCPACPFKGCIEVAQALGLLPYVAHSRRADRTSGPRVERRPS